MLSVKGKWNSMWMKSSRHNYVTYLTVIIGPRSKPSLLILASSFPPVHPGFFPELLTSLLTDLLDQSGQFGRRWSVPTHTFHLGLDSLGPPPRAIRCLWGAPESTWCFSMVWICVYASVPMCVAIKCQHGLGVELSLYHNTPNFRAAPKTHTQKSK